MMPSPMRRLAFTVASICGSGYGLTSMTSSRKRTASRTTRSSSSQSTDHSPAVAPPGELGDVDASRGCTPRSARAAARRTGWSPRSRRSSGVGFAGLALMRSMKTIPGSPVRHAARDDAVEDLARAQPARDLRRVRGLIRS